MWIESEDGLCLEIPAPWRGTEGAPPRLIELRHPDAQVEVWVDAWPADTPIPTPSEPWELRFTDPGGYRAVPVLSPASTTTWVHRDQPGPTRQQFRGIVGPRVVQVTVTYPFGGVVGGRDLVEPLLQALCERQAPGQRPDY